MSAKPPPPAGKKPPPPGKKPPPPGGKKPPPPGGKKPPPPGGKKPPPPGGKKPPPPGGKKPPPPGGKKPPPPGGKKPPPPGGKKPPPPGGKKPPPPGKKPAPPPKAGGASRPKPPPPPSGAYRDAQEDKIKKQQEDERLRREEQDRIRLEEEEERLRQEEEERLRQEEEEWKHQEEEEERLRKEEEERLRKEEEERLRKEEEERLKEEEEERLQAEEEEKLRLEEEERLREEEEERLREEEDALLKQEEARLQQEEEELLQAEDEEELRQEEERLREEEEQSAEETKEEEDLSRSSRRRGSIGPAGFAEAAAAKEKKRQDGIEAERERLRTERLAKKQPTPKRVSTGERPELQMTESGKMMKRRSTMVFLNDPTMEQSLEEMQRQMDEEDMQFDDIGGDSSKQKGDAANTVRAKRELDEKTLQQLRGIFAAHDEDRDLMLTKAQLAETIRALGFSPTEDLISKFLKRRKDVGSKLIDLNTFLFVAAEALEFEQDCSQDIRELFEVFDEKKTGYVTADTLRHVLKEVDCPEALSQAEFSEFMHYAGLMKNGEVKKNCKCSMDDLLAKLIMGGFS